MEVIPALGCGSAGREGAAAERLAVSAIRRSFHQAGGCAPVPRVLPTLVADLQAVGISFRAAHETMIGLQGAGLLVAPPGWMTLTRHERRLLRATAAAQANEDWLVDNVLFKLAPHPKARPSLVRAVAGLATSLATSGYWLLTLPVDSVCLPRSLRN